MDVSTKDGNLAAGRAPWSQSAVHSLAGRECAITIMNITMITVSTVNILTTLSRMARLDFVGIQPTNRAQLISSNNGSIDESMHAYGFVFQTQSNFNGTSTGSIPNVPNTPVTFTAQMSFGNILGINLVPFNIPPGGTSLPSWQTFITHACITIEVVPID